MAAATSTSAKPFDIVATYNELLRSDPDLTMPIAAIEALVLLLTHSPSSTISETLDLLEKSTAHLKQSIPNPIGLSAGTDLFQRYLITTLQRPGQLGPAGDFNAIRAHLLSNGRLFIRRAKESRDKIAAFGRGFVRDGSTVLTNGGSRVVASLLQQAAGEKGGPSAVRFRVIYVLSPAKGDVEGSSAEPEGMETVRALREKGVPVATIPESAVAYSLGKADVVIVGAEGVVENGGIVSRMGTYQIGLLAKAMGKPFYVVAESHKFVRLYPLGQYDLPIEQRVIDFKTEEDVADEATQQQQQAQPTPNVKSPDSSDVVDYTPPHLISALITDSGVLTPSAVSEELIKIWF
ncbi:translation initiation factor eIF2B subunit alpha [Aspergillus brunneoviolaceus CBS 621.78]|uniref:Translation initiation factor eIF2B subunit alpha n=5 Tax=Aspergillus TaxID=5052 RepID=A0A2V5I435_ASPV1|nr:nagb/rpia/CoA transferase-like protein [Aspergillus brunneoviolaceus CBS 621.78]XP_025532401.1 nagb/rpia/CoA transferase-like protein [Aspergillus japonicus CBS 114.51]XP_040803928.1 nagb/rpia/CoA transferase-like protein [Aspergillus fijiensis CBS 313.89]PYI14386.1 nagb/rpia/CoA transferase-like protein [Aspergillus violaceofuscus CBS 115571]PYI27152.1 nagb/rpia/CoA transferase-like protein [Aspergillus indologenus CBS 114.80]RAH44475.1 nagb/rpia/CoA transferase-like protein [Aspergillus b